MENKSGYWQYGPNGERGNGPGCGVGSVQVVGKFSGGCNWSYAVAAKFVISWLDGGYGGKPGCLGGGKLGIALQLVGWTSIGLLNIEMGVISGTFPCPKDTLNGYTLEDERN